MGEKDRYEHEKSMQEKRRKDEKTNRMKRKINGSEVEAKLIQEGKNF